VAQLKPLYGINTFWLACIASGQQVLQINDTGLLSTEVVAATILFVVMDKPGPSAAAIPTSALPS